MLSSICFCPVECVISVSFHLDITNFSLIYHLFTNCLFYISASIKWECEFLENADGTVTVQTIVHHMRESPVRATLDMTELTFDYQAPESLILALMDRSECRQLLQIDCSWYGNKMSWSGGLPSNSERKVFSTDTNENCSCPYVNRCDGEK